MKIYAFTLLLAEASSSLAVSAHDEHDAIQQQSLRGEAQTPAVELNAANRMLWKEHGHGHGGHGGHGHGHGYDTCGGCPNPCGGESYNEPPHYGPHRKLASGGGYHQENWNEGWAHGGHASYDWDETPKRDYGYGWEPEYHAPEPEYHEPKYAPEPEYHEPQYAPKNYYPHCRDPSKFIQCDGRGQCAGTQKCMGGTVWDDCITACQWPELASHSPCKGPEPWPREPSCDDCSYDICEQAKWSSKFYFKHCKDPTNSWYIQCNAFGKCAGTDMCMGGTVFDESIQGCNYPKTYPNWPKTYDNW